MAQERQIVESHPRHEPRPTENSSTQPIDRGNPPLETPADRRLQADLLLAERRRDARRNARRAQ